MNIGHFESGVEKISIDFMGEAKRRKALDPNYGETFLRLVEPIPISSIKYTQPFEPGSVHLGELLPSSILPVEQKSFMAVQGIKDSGFFYMFSVTLKNTVIEGFAIPDVETATVGILVTSNSGEHIPILEKLSKFVVQQFSRDWL